MLAERFSENFSNGSAVGLDFIVTIGTGVVFAVAVGFFATVGVAVSPAGGPV